jgi:hypothetical protein
MKSQTRKMTQIFTAFGAWAGRGLRYSRVVVTPADDMVQEYEAGIMPVLPQRTLPSFDDHATH